MKLWIARDFGEDCIWFYFNKPKLVNGSWRGTLVYNCAEALGINMHKNIFPEVTFENSPQEVEIKLVREKEQLEQLERERKLYEELKRKFE